MVFIISDSAAAVTTLVKCTVVRYSCRDSLSLSFTRAPLTPAAFEPPQTLLRVGSSDTNAGISLLGILVVTTVRANSLTYRNTQLKALIAEKCQTYPV